MVAETLSARARLAANIFGHAGRSAARQLLQSPFVRWRFGGPPIEQLLIVPQDLRTADPSFASEIYNGHFGLAGAIAQTGSESPFLLAPPSDAWEMELHGFGWLRHLRAAGDEISREHARVLIADWIKHYRKIGGLPWEPDIVARRLISWLSHGSIVLEKTDPAFYDAMMRSLSRQMRYLRAARRDVPRGPPRLTTLIALVFCGLCAAGEQSLADDHIKPFCDELDSQILPDGGHVSRCPGTLIDLLLDLLPLRQCFTARDQVPPEALVQAIERMMVMLRFFRLGGGGLARFNGMSATPADTLASVLAYDDAQGAREPLAEPSGYCRMDRGTTALLADVGTPPPVQLSGQAHAGCLAFELSSGDHLIFVNCGASGNGDDGWQDVVRATAAHSTVTVADTSSSRFLPARRRDREPGSGISGPRTVTAELTESESTMVLEASHDGYLKPFGLTHVRKLALIASGARLIGGDRLVRQSGTRAQSAAEQLPFAVRFHLHPSVRAQLSQDNSSALLVLPNHEGWRFAAKDRALEIEESVYLADNKGPRRTLQLVISGTTDPSGETEIVWMLEKSPKAAAPGKAEKRGAADDDELPLE